MSAGFPRHLLKWLLGLDLSIPIKNVKRDFANGFLVAEICYKYFPSDFGLHSFENVVSNERKASNWLLLERTFKKLRFPVTPQLCAAVRAAQTEAAAVELVQILHDVLERVTAQDAAQQAETLVLDVPESPSSGLQAPTPPPAPPAAAQKRDRGSKQDAKGTSRPNSRPQPSVKFAPETDGRPSTRGDKSATAGKQPADVIDPNFDPLAVIATSSVVVPETAPKERPEWREVGAKKWRNKSAAWTAAPAPAAGAAPGSFKGRQALTAQPGPSSPPVPGTDTPPQQLPATAPAAPQPRPQAGTKRKVAPPPLPAPPSEPAEPPPPPPAQPVTPQKPEPKPRRSSSSKGPPGNRPGWQTYDRAAPQPTVPRERGRRVRPPGQQQQQQQQGSGGGGEAALESGAAPAHQENAVSPRGVQTPTQRSERDLLAGSPARGASPPRVPEGSSPGHTLPPARARAPPAQPSEPAACLSDAADEAAPPVPGSQMQAEEQGNLEGQQDQGRSTADEEEPSIFWDKRARKVRDFKPYSADDYLGKEYMDPKRSKYWKLGGLGRGDTQEVLAKRETAKQLKDLSLNIRAQNLLGKQSGPPAPKPAVKDNARERAKAYSETVPKPKFYDDLPISIQSSTSLSLQAADPELVMLEQQHAMDQQTVDQIRSLHSPGTAAA